MVQKATGQLTIYDQNDPIIAGAAPASPAVNALWLDNNVVPNMLKRWNGTSWAPVGALDANYSSVISGINNAITTINETTLPALEDGLLTKAEKTGIQTSSDIVVAEKKEIDAAYNALYTNENLLVKTVISTPKGAYDTAYTNLMTAIATVMNAPDGVLLPVGAVTAARNALSAYADKLALFRTAMQTAQKNIEAQIQTETASGLTSALQNYVTTATYGADYAAIQAQVDKSITTWFGSIEPTLANLPASDWTTNAIKDTHLGDIYYNTITGYAHRFMVSASIYSWARITDSDVTLALSNAAAAQDTADGKRRVFVAQPVAPYDIGDLWTQGTTGDLMRCKTAKVAGGAYAASDWEKASKYTDDTLASTANTAAQQAQTTANTAVTNAGLAQTAANTANTSIGDIVSDAKLTGNEKPEVRKEWNILVSAAILNSTQASAFGVSATAYQNAIAALGLYLNNNVAFTYANATAGSIPSWIADANLGTATTIVGSTYRATWKTYYDAHVALMNAIATKAKALADAAQDTADNLEFGGRNIVKHAAIVSYNTSITSYLEDTNTWNLSVASGMTRAGFAISGTTVRIPYGRTYVLSFEVFCPFTTTWSMDINNYPVSGAVWTSNDNDTGALRKQSSSTVTANQWVKCWYGFTNTNAGNTLKVDLYDGSNFGINNTSGATANFQIRNVKGELGTKPTEWTPAPEDVQAKITESNTNLNSLRQSMDNTKAIRLGMKIGYSSFSTVASGYLYLCGLQLNPTTFVEELADVNGSLYGSFYNSATGVVEPRVTIAVAKQAVNLNGVALGTTGYLIWDNTAKAIWFAHFIKTVGADGVVTAEYWNKRNVGKVGDNTELVLDASTYVIGELEI